MQSSTRRWINQSHPQTLLIATWLLYLEAIFGIIDFRPSILSSNPVWGVYFVMRIAGSALGARGIANDQKWGYYLGLAAAATPFALRLYLIGNPFASDLLTLAFEVALVALLVHPMSREYQKIWFK
jgi:hypothetical protein